MKRITSGWPTIQELGDFDYPAASLITYPRIHVETSVRTCVPAPENGSSVTDDTPLMQSIFIPAARRSCAES